MHNDTSNVQKSAYLPKSHAQVSELSIDIPLPQKLTLDQFTQLRRKPIERCFVCGEWCEVQHILGHSPVSNTGVKSPKTDLSESVKTCQPAQVIIDTLTFSFSGLAFDLSVKAVSRWLSRWTSGALKVGGPLDKRYNGYPKCFQIIAGDGAPSPMLGWLGTSAVSDHMRGRWCIHLTGVGCACASSADKTWINSTKVWIEDYQVDYVAKDSGSWINSWERLALDADAYAIKITRIDLAVDDLSGEHSIESVRELYDKGGFSMGGRNPSYKLIKTSKGCGDSFYVGKLESGKCLRVYEKGKHLGCKTSEWVRWEAQIMAINRVIPIRVLCEPGRYLRGAYDIAMSWIGVASLVIHTRVEKGRLLFEKAIEHAKRQVGSFVRYLKDARVYSEKDIVETLIGKEGSYPLRLFEYDLSFAFKE